MIFNGSRAALPEAARVFPDLRVILVTAPEIVLAARLAARGRESKKMSAVGSRVRFSPCPKASRSRPW